MAPGIMPPPASRQLLPAIVKAANYASKSADKYNDRFDQFVDRLVFDMFAALSLGEFMRTTSLDHQTEENELFLKHVLSAFKLGGKLLVDPFGKLKPWKIREFEGHYSTSVDISMMISARVGKKILSGNGTEFNENSYMGKMLSEEVEFDKVQGAVAALLQAGVDTTGYLTNWLLLNLAMNPEKQQTLRQELKQVLNGEDLHEEALKKLPYLKACARESHRLTPTAPFAIMKKSSVPLNLHGYEIPAGSLIILGSKHFCLCVGVLTLRFVLI